MPPRPVDPFFTWIETTALSTMLRESPSLWAFPFVLILHTVGLAFLVGANVALDVRVLGLARGVPLRTLRSLRRGDVDRLLDQRRVGRAAPHRLSRPRRSRTRSST